MRSRFELTLPMRASVVAATVVILGWFLFMSYETTNMMPPILPGYPGDSFFPRLVLLFGLVCAVTILIKAALKPRGVQLAAGEDQSFSFHWVEFLSVCVLVVGYGLLLEPVGFEITTFVLMLALLAPRMAAGSDHPARSLGYAFALSLATTLFAYVGFGLLLRIPLPLLFLPRYIQY
jgi:putative tricarboxylic transport membrane protein